MVFMTKWQCVMDAEVPIQMYSCVVTSFPPVIMNTETYLLALGATALTLLAVS